MGAGHDHSAETLDLGRSPALRALFAVVIATGLACVVGLLALWPSGDGQAEAEARAQELGLLTDRVGATVIEAQIDECSFLAEPGGSRCQLLTVEITEGPEAGATLALPETQLDIGLQTFDVEPGDDVVLGYSETTNTYALVDVDRTAPLLLLAVMFGLLVVLLGRLRGVAALVGMACTVIALVAFVAPAVLDGHDPVLVSVIAAGLIAFVGIYLIHGVNALSTVALASTLASLGITLLLSVLFFEFASFSGYVGDESLTLPVIARDIDIAGLLLGGAVLGSLGALDDVTITQVSLVAELRRRSPDLTTRELVTSGIRVGRDHIASTVNTLLLAYVGASMPLLLLFSASSQSLVDVANSEVVATEIVRTLTGSIGLIAAVPLATILAALVAPTELRAEALPGMTETTDRSDHADDRGA